MQSIHFCRSLVLLSNFSSSLKLEFLFYKFCQSDSYFNKRIYWTFGAYVQVGFYEELSV